MFTYNPLLILFLLCIKYCLNQNLTNCEDRETCRECIFSIECMWCVAPKPGQAHCMSKSTDHEKWCQTENHIINPTSTFKTIADNSLSSDEGNTVQIRPQHIRLQLRKNEEFNLEFQYAHANNYPVDLYYIMDLSASMEAYRNKLAKLGVVLANTMQNITSNFRLGFGSFVDKVDMPFVSTNPKKLLSPCTLLDGSECVGPYSFKNHLSLTEKYQQFNARVNQARVSGNLDSPEGGFDAIMQAIVCKSEIGWREQARHLLVFSTDALFHIAGDGKLAGIIEPNDAQCHMSNNEYTDYLEYDYPSVSQINYIAKENNINLIFAIAKDSVVGAYKSLTEVIENSKVGKITDKTDSVIDLVVDNYNKIVDAVTIASNSSTDVEVKISSTCPNPKENGCTNIHVGEVINFTATIKPLQCGRNNQQTITIKPEGLQESIVIDLEIFCGCNCESPGNNFYEPNSPDCTNNGTLKCGICDCNEGRFGSNCECDRSSSQSEDTALCRRSPTDEICSGSGTCKCGKCECTKRPISNERIYGKFCQCDNFSCDRKNGILCSNRGTCDCGVCKCHAGWSGGSCQCPDTNSTCIKPGSEGAICSGHGACKCGECECIYDAENNYRYSGKFCEECPSCPGQRCDELRNCVECQAYKDGAYDEKDCRLQCTSFVTELVDKIEEDNIDSEKVKICRIADKDGCTFTFQYEYLDDKELAVKAMKEKICIGALNLLVWILGVIGTVVLAGLIILIIWKVCTTIHDRREYARFEHERNKMKWHRNDNPLYKQATSTFSNPLFGKSNRLSFRNKTPR